MTGKVGHVLPFGRKRHTSESMSESKPQFRHQVSFQTQTSVVSEREKTPGAAQVKRQLSKKQEEELDKDVPQVSLFRVIKVNAREWWLICLGLFGAALNACTFPTFALLFGEVLRVFALPKDQVLNEIHLFAGLFIMLGVVSAIGHLLKVRCY